MLLRKRGKGPLAGSPAGSAAQARGEGERRWEGGGGGKQGEFDVSGKKE